MVALPNLPPEKMTPAEYLAMERSSEFKHEYFDGEIVAMTGVRRAHSLVNGTMHNLLYNQLRGGACEVHQSDLRVFAPKLNSYTYPDLVVFCGEPEFPDNEFDTLLNPIVVIEILSESTERYDRGRKAAAYRAIPTVIDLLLVTKEEPLIEHQHRMGEERWLLETVRGLDAVITLESIGCTLALADVYERIRFDAPEANNETPPTD